MRRVCLIILTLLLSCSASAQSFDPAEYFAPSKVTKNDKTGLIDVSDELTGKELPGWVRVSLSGSGLAAKRFSVGETGLELKPDKDSGTVEAGLNLKITEGSFSVQVSELAVKASIAWHIHTEADEYLVELKRTKVDEGRLRVRVFNGRRFMVVETCDQTIANFEPPARLGVSLSMKGVTATLKGESVDVTLKGPMNGATFRAGLAVSDARAKAKDLKLSGMFSPDWELEAASQMHAERALANLSQYAREGATRGLFEAEHPNFDAEWKALGKDNRKLWKSARKVDDFKTLQRMAGEAGGLLYEVGKLAQRKRKYELATECYEISYEKSKFIPAQLAAIELRHVPGQEESTIKKIKSAQEYIVKMEPAIQAEFDLMLARYRVAGGTGLAGATNLAGHVETDSLRPALQAFAESANELMQPSVPLLEMKGPFGVQLLTDMPEAELKALLETLKPVEREIKNWIPEKQADCSDSYLVVYTDPVRYLTAALLPAGNNLDHAAGMFMKRGINDKRTILACGAFGRDELYRTLSHELWHMVASANDIPRWLDEGMAMCVSTATTDGGIVDFASIPTELDEAQRKLAFEMTAEDVKAALGADGHAFYGKDVRKNYALAWAWVWWMSENADGRKLLRTAIKGEEVELAIDEAGVAKVREALTKKFKPKES
ncbi:MAG: hypothetical protein ACYTDT_00280 [Planctomycetota bacterium]